MQMRFPMSRLQSRIFGHKAGTKRRSPQQRSALQVEGLETRLVPTTFAVNTTADTLDPSVLSLRRAINLANAHPGPDTILLPAGTYTITREGQFEEGNAKGDFDIRDSVTFSGV